MIFIKKFLRRRSPPEIFIFVFLVIIFIGAGTLMLPIASKTGQRSDFLTAIFTSFSSVCGTGMTVADTFSHWSFFGQAVIIFLVQLGGLGFMTIMTLFSLVFRRTIGHKERMIMAHSLNLHEMAGVVKLTRQILLGTLAFEGAAAIVLTVRFIPKYGFLDGLWKGIFISISAFCNAGFDNFEKIIVGKNAISPIFEYVDDITVTLTVGALMLLGSFGFMVWSDVLVAKKFTKMSIMSQIVLFFSAVLVIFGFIAILLFESGNPETLGGLSPKGQILAALFHSISARTGGFSTVEISLMSETTKAIIVILMFIGGASGSTSGGIKINTVAVLFLATVAVFKGEKNATLMKKRISDEIVLRAFALVSLSSAMLLTASILLSVVEKMPFLSAVFECVSAFSTAGVLIMPTESLSAFSLVILMILMFLGRIGFISLSMALFLRQQKSTNKISYPEAKIVIG